MNVAKALALALLLASCASNAGSGGQDTASAATEARALAPLNVWPGIAPGSEGWTQKEVQHDLGMGTPNLVVRNVTTPTITAYLPASDKATGTSVIIAPGGGFLMRSINRVGNDAAQWLADRGVAAFVLKYRLSETAPDVPTFTKQIMAGVAEVMPKASAPPQETGWFDKEAAIGAADALKAMEVIRAHARDWNINPNRIGMMGFSAGAQVTSEVLIGHNAQARLAFAAPIYGGLFGRKFVAPIGLPPVFAAVAKDDPLAYATTLSLAETLKASGAKTDLHVYAAGGHGFGMNKTGKPTDAWIDDFYAWLGAEGFLKPATGN